MIKRTLLLLLLGAVAFALGFAGKAKPSATKVASPADAKREIARVLQRQDPAAAVEAMARLAKEDPHAFFRELEHFPWLDGVNELVLLAACELHSTDPAVAAKILNGISRVDHRQDAWLGYALSLEDRSLSQKLEVAGLAEPSSQQRVLIPLLSIAVHADMEGTLRELSKEPYRKYYADALVQLGATEPLRVVKRAKQSVAEGDLDADLFWAVMRSSASTEDRAEGAEVVAEIANRDMEALPFGNSERIFYQTLFLEDRIGMEEILALPEMRRNMILSNIPLDYCDGPAEVAAVLNGMTSTSLQAGAVEDWLAMRRSDQEVSEVMDLIESPKAKALIEERLREREGESDPE